MEMCYDGTLVMPSSYAVMSEEEMTYVEGGWTTYTGWNAVIQISVIAGCTFISAAAAKKMAMDIIGLAASGVGVPLAVAKVIGLAAMITLTALQTMLTICAVSFFVESWKKYGDFNRAGFQATGVSIWTFTAVTGVRGL